MNQPAVPAPREADVQRACVQVAAARGVKLYRNNSRVLRMTGRRGRRRLMRFGLAKGSSDLIGMLPPSGRFLAVEVKRPGERPTPAQVAWLAEVRLAGGVGCWVDDAATLDGILGRLLAPGGFMLTVEVDPSGEQFFVEKPHPQPGANPHAV